MWNGYTPPIGQGEGEAPPGAFRRCVYALAVGGLVGWLIGSAWVGAVVWLIVWALAEVKARRVA